MHLKVLDSSQKKIQTQSTSCTLLEVIDEINEGDNVEFELKEGRKGMNAVNVRVV